VVTVSSKIFERLSLAVIFTNCIILGLEDPADTANATLRNQIANQSEDIFTVIFTVELVLKVSGLVACAIIGSPFAFAQRCGSCEASQTALTWHCLPCASSSILASFALNPCALICTDVAWTQVTALGWVGRGSYLANRWNWLDLAVVSSGYVSMLPYWTHTSLLRVFRVLRPLRTLTSMTSLRVVVQSLLASLPALLSVALMAVFLFLVFGIIGVQLWSGVLAAECGAVGSGIPCALSCNSTTCLPAYGDSCPSRYGLCSKALGRACWAC
jgi:hypothetical protein